MTEEQKTKNHYEMLNNSSNKSLVDLIKMQDNKITDLEEKLANADYQLEGREVELKELQAQIEKMKAELHHRLISPSHDDSDCLDKIVGLDCLWQFGQEF